MKQVRISDQVMDYIVDLIAEGGHGPGDALPSEVELSRRLTVSRPAVREATNALAGRGVLTVSSGRSPAVSGLDQNTFAHLLKHGMAIGQVTMLDVMALRRGIEDVVAELAARNRTSGQAKEIKDIAAALSAASGQVDVFWQLDLRFHSVLAQAAGNRLLSALLEAIGEVASQSTRLGLGMARDKREWREIAKVHLDIAAGVAAGDPDAARAAMAAHFASATGRFERSLSEQQEER